MTVSARTYPIAIVVLAAGLLLAAPSGASPLVIDEGIGIRRAIWDFSAPTDYFVQNATLEPGAASLAKATAWSNYTSDGNFSSAEMQAANVTISSGVRLAGNVTNLIADGTFDAAPGPWTYTNGTTGAVLAVRDASGRGRFDHQSSVFRLDSMDDVFGPNPWVSSISAPGQATSSLFQETAIRAEGSGSLRADVTTLLGSCFCWGGATRNDPGFWDWSAYNRLAIRMNKATPGLSWAFVYVEDQFGTGSYGFMSPIMGWFRYAVDLSTSLDFSAINFIRVGFGGAVGVTSTIYVDDIVLFDSTVFAESARVAQTFAKPFATGAGPNAVGLRFDMEATSSVNVDARLELSVNGSVEWSETPVIPGARSLEVDLSGNVALRGTGSFTLGLSLRLNRTGWEESSMTAWIDNVRLIAWYQNGSFVSLPLDAGSAAVWGNVELTRTTPPGTSVGVETRTGSSTSPGDGSWTQWQLVLQNTTQSPPNRYLQWRLLLTTGGVETPVVSRLGVSQSKYASSGEIRIAPFMPADQLVAWRQFLANDTTPGPTGIVYDVSFDGGGSWTSVSAGQDLSPFPNSTVVVRATLTTSNTSRTPSIASWSLRYEITTTPGAPHIDDVVPDQVAQEDAPSWSLDLIRFAGNQTDPADTLANLKWYLTGINTSLYSVFGADTYGRHTLAFTPAKDAFGSDDATLWLEDRDGAKASQPLRVTIQPVNDPPVWAHVPEVWVRHDQTYTLYLIPYVTDQDTPSMDLTFSSEDASHITIVGPNATYLYPSPSGPRYVLHHVMDGQAPPTPTLVTIHVTDSPPPQSSRPIPDITLTEDVKGYDVFRPDSLGDYFVSIGGRPLTLSSDFTSLNVELWSDGPNTKVNVSANLNFCGADRITFRATDDTNAFAEYTSAVTVLCVNDPPFLGWGEDVHVRFDAPYRLDLSSSVDDVDNPRDQLSLTTSDPVHARANQFSVTFLYPSSEFGPSPVAVPLDLTLTDRDDGTTVHIQVFVSDNRPPENVRPFDDLRFLEDTVLRDALNLPLHFVDDEDRTLGYEVTASTLNITVSLGLVTLLPPPNWFGEDALTIRAEDTKGAFALVNVPVKVLPVNDAPVLDALPAQTSAHGGKWILDLREFVSDVEDEDEELNFSTDSPNVQAVGYLLVFTYPDREASDSVVIRVSDRGNATATVTLSVRVGSPAYWPWIVALAAAIGAASYAGWWTRGRRGYSIEDFMVIGHEGLLIAHTSRRQRAGPDADTMAAMMTATLMFIRDSFREDKDELQRFELSHDRVGIVQKSAHVYGVAMAIGRVPDAPYLDLKGFLEEVERRHGERLALQVGAFDAVLPELKWAMIRFARRGRYKPGDFDHAVTAAQEENAPPIKRRWLLRRPKGPTPDPTPIGDVASPPLEESGRVRKEEPPGSYD